jgi:hypothetical protein
MNLLIAPAVIAALAFSTPPDVPAEKVPPPAAPVAQPESGAPPAAVRARAKAPPPATGKAAPDGKVVEPARAAPGKAPAPAKAAETKPCEPVKPCSID